MLSILMFLSLTSFLSGGGRY